MISGGRRLIRIPHFKGSDDTIRNAMAKRWLSAQQTPYEKGTPTTTTEWQQARPFSELYTENPFQLLLKFLPGGQYHQLDSTQLLKKMFLKYSDIFIMPAMMGRPAIVMTQNPDDFEQVFRNEGTWPHRPSSESLAYHRGKQRADFYQGVEGLIATHGEQWATFRSAVNPILLQPKNIKIYIDKMAQVNQQFTERIRAIRDPETLEMPNDFLEWLNRWALETVSIVALDRQLGLLHEHDKIPAEVWTLFSSMSDFFSLSFEVDIKPSPWRYITTPKFKRLMRSLDNIQNTTLKYINAAVERLELEKRQGIERPEHEQSILEKLHKVDRKIATVMGMDMLMAGVDTTTTVITGVLLCLAKNHEKQQKLRAEVKRVLPQRDGKFTSDALNNIPYLRACLKEALRVYPLGTGNIRVIPKDLVLSGYQVPKNTWVSVIASNLLMDERYYPRAQEYLPERWLRGESTQSLKPINPFIYIPFGFGPRQCVGRRISEMELELGIARLVRNFYIEFNYPTKDAFKSATINMPNIPLKFKFTDID